MCGIAGIHRFKNDHISDRQYIAYCVADMYRRGPDASGIWQNAEGYTCGAVRLAIRDVHERAGQPMISADGRYCLVYNGELYNTNELKKHITDIPLYTSSDTEILLQLFMHYPPEFILEKLDGMFAFAFHDKQKNETCIARDRMGIKPLYVGKSNTMIIFSSQYNHIIQHPDFYDNAIDTGALGNYLQLGFIPDNAGFKKNTFLFPHGHYAIINDTDFAVHQYAAFTDGSSKNEIELSEPIIKQTVKSQLVSDVPVGVLFSGGVDSSLLALWVNESKPVKAFMVDTGNEKKADIGHASAFAASFGIEHHIDHLNKTDLLKLLDENFLAYPEPFADFSSIPSLQVCEAVSKHAKVVLSGDGPDELLYGYNRNIKVFENGHQFFQPAIMKAGNYLYHKYISKNNTADARIFSENTFSEYYYRMLFRYGSDTWFKKIYKEQPSPPYFLQSCCMNSKQEETETYMDAVRYLETHIHLQRVLLKLDRASMYHSIEARVPYLGNDLAETCNHIPASACIKEGQGKYPLKKILAERYKSGYAFARKRGFGVPVKTWIRTILKNEIEEKIMTMPGDLQHAFNKKQLHKLLHEHIYQQKDHSGIIWALYALVKWYDIFNKPAYKTAGLIPQKQRTQLL